MSTESKDSKTTFLLSEDLSLDVQTRPVHLTFMQSGISVLSSYGQSPVVLTDGFFEERVSEIVSAVGAAGNVDLKMRTERGREVSLRIEYDSDNFKAVLRLDSTFGYSRIGFNFSVSGDESWFGADILASSTWPLDSGFIDRDSWLSSDNQTSPIWLSSKGVGICNNSYQQLGFQFNGLSEGTFSLYAMNSRSFRPEIIFGDTIREAHARVMRVIGTPVKTPPVEYFRKPVYCTWINFLTDVNQQGISSYVDEMYAAGFSCGVFMIDDKWMPRYGDLRFDSGKFPQPRELIKRLHSLGMKVALWVTPFVDRDSANYRFLLEKGYLIARKDGIGPYYSDWWNGNSALLDLSNPEARNWFLLELKQLIKAYDLDGFKFDAGDGSFLKGGYTTLNPMNPLEYTDEFAKLGAEFGVTELRVGWLTQKYGLVQRLRDKAPTWSDIDGLGSIIPHGLTEGLIGYPFFSADMIGGGWDVYFRESERIDEELFVRWTEACALFPIMQFSYAPWRLGIANRKICLKYARLHEEFSDYILRCAEQAAGTGFPIVTPLFLHFPEEQLTYSIKDQYMLGDLYLVAPVVTKGTIERDVYLPSGTWKDYWSGEIFEGQSWLRGVSANLDELPLFIRIS